MVSETNDEKKPFPTAWKVAGLTFAGVFILGFWIDAQQPRTSGQVEATTSLATLQARVMDNAIEEMDPGDYPDSYNQLGAEAFGRANEMARWAAIAALTDQRCPKVDIVAISDRASSENLVWLVECDNRERFFISEQQAAAVRARFDETGDGVENQAVAEAPTIRPESARWDDFSEAEAVTACDMLTKGAMLNPRSFSPGWSWDRDRDSATGEVTFQRDFTADAALGEINSRYRCVFNADEGTIVSLAIREIDGWRSIYDG